jgi:Polyketide cyclase / dehydrase and lipid transport
MGWKMTERYSAAHRIDAPVERVWRLLSDLGNKEVAEGFCRGVRVHGSGVGAVRTFELLDDAGGGEVSERIEQFDNEAHYFGYRVFDIGPLPFADYVGSIRLAAAGPQRCVAIYHATFIALDDFSPTEAMKTCRQNFEFLVTRLRTLSSKEYGS